MYRNWFVAQSYVILPLLFGIVGWTLFVRFVAAGAPPLSITYLLAFALLRSVVSLIAIAATFDANTLLRRVLILVVGLLFFLIPDAALYARGSVDKAGIVVLFVFYFAAPLVCSTAILLAVRHRRFALQSAMLFVLAYLACFAPLQLADIPNIHYYAFGIIGGVNTLLVTLSVSLGFLVRRYRLVLGLPSVVAAIFVGGLPSFVLGWSLLNAIAVPLESIVHAGCLAVALTAKWWRVTADPDLPSETAINTPPTSRAR